MEQTIEERAYNLYPVYMAIVNGRNIDTNEDRRRAFIAGATEQKQIDFGKIDDDCEGCDLCRQVYQKKFIENADKWLRVHLPRVIDNYPRGDNETTVMLNEDMRTAFRADMAKEMEL